MKTKLTLSVEKDITIFAHELSQKEGISISRIVSNYLLERKIHQERNSELKVSDMVGVLNGYKIDDSKLAIRKLYAKKYTS